VNFHTKIVIDWLLNELLLELLFLLSLFGQESSSISLELKLLQVLSELLW